MKVGGLFIRKSVETLQQDARTSKMKRSLSALDVVGIGIGEIIGAVFAGIACAFAGLCYSEMASMVPSSGSAYVYTYTAVGELLAWIVGWDLMLEYMIGAATVAVGWSGYVVNFIEQVSGSKIPKTWVLGPWTYSDTAGFGNSGGILNIPAIVIALFCTVILVFGVRQSAMLNHTLVGIKVAVVLLFLFATFSYIDTANWTPFIPGPDGKTPYGWGGVFRGATMVFFAYIGFDAVSTVAQETKRPERDIPIGVLGSLTICTILYILVSLNLTGIVNFKQLAGHAPLADALEIIHLNWMRAIVNVGGIAGLTSVILISLMGQPRVFFAMAYDGLLPPVFAKLHPRYGTPYVPTIFSGIICAIAAGLLPLEVLGDITSAGTLFAFALVSLSVGILRFTRPDVERKFKVPLGPVVPTLGFVTCVALIIYTGGPTILRLVIWMAIGLLVYFGYGYRHSRARTGAPPPPGSVADPEQALRKDDKDLGADSGTEMAVHQKHPTQDANNSYSPV